MFTQRLVYACDSNIIQNSQKCETIQYPTDEWIKQCGTLMPWNII